ncbi:Sec-independent protein translocase protein TatB [Niveispirillum sp. KHB5.9]|uniref:Sec-independent protein translocase protein TatB n=1 Tax=Niveispirillum sp. KHB5.9 TaxID=3400269 RepID=UPI003A88866D
MFDIGWSELLVIGVVALIVIGPKDLPKALSTMGKWVARARGMAREFQNSVDDMVRQAELDELREQVQKARNFNLQDELEKSIDPDGEVRKTLVVEDFTTPATGTQAKPEDKPASPAADVSGEEVADLASAATPLPAPPAAEPVAETVAAPTEPTKDKTP